jgi:phosphatidylglycerol:prolipoprotein diacylglycerol transferase
MQGLGISSGLFLFYIRTTRTKFLSKGKSLWFIILVAFFGVLGARIFYFLVTEPSFIIENFKKLFSPYEIYWHGGFSSFGGILGGLIYAIYFSKKNKISFWKLADFATPSIALALSFFRTGCFLNGCCYGRPTKLFWGVFYKSQYAFAPKGIALHPVQLYEVTLTLILFIIFLRKRPKFAGYNILQFAIFYNFFRFLIEFLKWVNPVSKLIPINPNQAFAILFFTISIFIKHILTKINAR